MEASFEMREEAVVVILKGRLDFETTEPFRRTCRERLVREKVVLDLKGLSFVGSLGLKEFVDTVDQLARTSSSGVRFCGVSSEFRRLFEASGMNEVTFFESRDKAVESFRPVAPAPVSNL
jgi:anti-anti-sigma factor